MRSPKFSRNSWHRSLYRWTYWSNPEDISLCPYFWKVIGATLTYPFRLMSRTIPHSTKDKIETLGVVALLVTLFGFIAFLAWDWFTTGRWFPLATVIIAFSPRPLRRLYQMGSKRWHHVPTPPKPLKVKQPSLLSEFLKAKWRKVCPKVQWYD